MSRERPTPDCFKAVSVQSYEHISMHAVYLRAPPLPICRCAIMIRGKRSAWMKYLHLSSPCRLPTRTCVNFSWISIPMIGRSQVTSTNGDTDASTLYFKSAELSSIRFRYCKGLRTFRNIKDGRLNRILLLLVWEYYWFVIRQVCGKKSTYIPLNPPVYLQLSSKKPLKLNIL